MNTRRVVMGRALALLLCAVWAGPLPAAQAASKRNASRQRPPLDREGRKVWLYVYHRDYQPGGVRSVIDSQLSALMQRYSRCESFAMGDVKYPERHSDLSAIPPKNHIHLDAPRQFEPHEGPRPQFRSRSEFERAARSVADEILQKMDVSSGLDGAPHRSRGLTFFMPHNASLISPTAAEGVRTVAEYFREHQIPGGVLIQPHDFPTENRHSNLRRFLRPFEGSGKGGSDRVSEADFARAGQMIFGAPAAFVLINKRDYRDMVSLAGLPEGRVYYLPDTIDSRAVCQNVTTQEARDVLTEVERGYPETFDLRRRTMLLPIRVARKKNVKEALLTLVLFNGLLERQRQDKYQILITMDATEGSDGVYARQIKDLAARLELPVTVGFMTEHAEPVVRAGRGKSALFEAADVIDVTSVMEGFGLSIGEGSLSNTLVVGRKLAVYDWKGVDTSHMWEGLYVPLDGRFGAVVDEAELRDLYVERLGRARAGAGFDPGGMEITRDFAQAKLGGHARRVDYADLSDGQQDRVVELTHTSPEALAELLAANPRIPQAVLMAEAAHRLRVPRTFREAINNSGRWATDTKMMWRASRLLARNRDGFAKNYGDAATAERLRRIFTEVAASNEALGRGTAGTATTGLSDEEAAVGMKRLIDKYYGLPQSRLLLLPE